MACQATSLGTRGCLTRRADLLKDGALDLK